ncbi:MAG: hypothetical protein D8M58_13990 [Calditrichaeota bacterium]|nr:MAG: hypothetical protein DWQ03_15230 [Calditrichota bacterium]MBL1206510.1 hypothetical protein [Calditrichota bacterium]NOG46338.1 hypothetical protein [Calditrichota bacterium]
MQSNYNKGYITAREFVNSWEKEVYELTYLDYFIYLLINDLGLLLERDFFPKIDREELFYLSSDEISALAFNIGDGLQLFLDKNCFGGCSLGCPNKLSKPFSSEENEIRINFVTTEFDGITSSCTNREDCLYHDVMNYVVIDALLDFYNYEMGVVLHEKDPKLIKLATFTMDHIISFTQANGPKLLEKPNDLATDLFTKDLQGDEDVWEEIVPENEELDDDVSEAWKVYHVSVNAIFSNFETESFDLLEKPFSKKLLKEFRAFLNDYLEVNRLDDFEFEYIEEFFSLIFPQVFLLDDNVDFDQFESLFSKLFDYIDQNGNTKLAKAFVIFKQDELKEIKRTFSLTQNFQLHYSYVDFLLSNEASNPTLLEGYFEVSALQDGFAQLKNVDQRTVHDNVNLGVIKSAEIKIGDILHVQLIADKTEMKIVYLELVYPSVSKYFLY